MNCRDCKHWDAAPVCAPWAGALPSEPHDDTERERRALRASDALDEHVCHRFGGFSSSGGYGEHSEFDAATGRRLPMIGYMLSHTCSAQFVTTGDFGCARFEAA